AVGIAVVAEREAAAGGARWTHEHPAARAEDDRAREFHGGDREVGYGIGGAEEGIVRGRLPVAVVGEPDPALLPLGSVAAPAVPAGADHHGCIAADGLGARALQACDQLVDGG